ncbi:MAG: hypothetical protein KA792_04020 [Bacteroidales bacterium]|nr:hypothetical protein [Bacteroidales bacterium]
MINFNNSNFIKGKTFIFIIFILFAVYFLYVLSLTTGTYSGDCISHHVISRYAFQYPHLFLDHWGKPVFTLLSSPFSQFGLKGTQFFNMLAGLLTAYIIYLIAKRLEYKNAFAVIFFVLLIPLYFRICFTSLTEISFSLLLSLSILLFLDKKYIAGTILVSFLPFARTESVLLFPAFALILIFRKQLLKIPLFLTGSIVYTIAGAWYYKDFYWIINKCPYQPFDNSYGRGKLFDFVKALPDDLGWVLIILSLSGFIFMFFKYIYSFRSVFKKEFYLNEEFLLISFNFLVFFIAHSLLWYFGLFHSFGLTRVVAAVYPLSALVALYGLNFILQFFPSNFSVFRNWGKFINVQHIILFIVITFVFINNYKKNKVPFRDNLEEELIYSCSNWLKAEQIKYSKVFFFHPSVIMAFEINPYEKKTGEEAWFVNKEKPSISLPAEAIIIWDAHFAVNEGQFPLKSLIEDPDLVLLKVFEPSAPLYSWGEEFKVYVFKRKI